MGEFDALNNMDQEKTSINQAVLILVMVLLMVASLLLAILLIWITYFKSLGSI
jgi:hypothetical protein